jgi:UDP-N-acetylmuramoyl-L-alanyl-D-glutamate--2,6-diaminopimelate ligase
MNNELVVKLLGSKVESKNLDLTSSHALQTIEWKTQDSSQNSILFYKITEGSEEKFLSTIQNTSYGLLIVNYYHESFKSLKNVLVTTNEEWLECQKILLDHLYPFPFSQIKLVGITGTNGKTTTTDLIRQIALNDGKKVLTIGTLGVKKNQDQIIPEGLTTPPYIDLRKILFHHAKDVELIVMEVSSHSLVQERVYKFKYDAVAWTSFSQDHLDFHRDLEDYFRAKTLLIEKHLKVGSPCFIPAYEEELFAKLKNYPGTHKTKTLIERKIETLPLFFMSHFNKSNLEVAWDLCEYLWKKKMQPDLFKFKMTEGRFSIFAHENKKIIIDFAHTPDALKNICEATRLAFPDSKIHLVFGCGGNRDKGKRPQMGKIAEDMANYIYVTSDNPRHEKPEEIIQDIIHGMTHKNHQVIVKREEAIKAAFNNLHDQDVLIIAGKGHENYQIIGDLKLEYTDQAVVDKLIKGKHV